MKEFLATWIVIQLIVIGINAADIHNQMVDKKLDCTPQKISPWKVAVAPLVVFVPDFTADYCKEHK